MRTRTPVTIAPIPRMSLALSKSSHVMSHAPQKMSTMPRARCQILLNFTAVYLSTRMTFDITCRAPDVSDGESDDVARRPLPVARRPSPVARCPLPVARGPVRFSPRREVSLYPSVVFAI